MRWLYSFMTLGLILAMFFIYALYRFTPHYLEVGPASVEIARLKTEFKNRNHPVFHIDLEALERNVKSEELRDPSTAIPQLAHFRHEEIAAVVHYADTCDSKTKFSSHSLDLKKAMLWHQHLCIGKKLPSGFFETAPRMHPSGSSYARLAQLTGEKFPSKERHLLELLNLDISPDFNMDANALAEAEKGEDSILTHHHILLVDHVGSEEFSNRYSAYPLKLWDEFIRGKTVVPAGPLHMTHCLVREGSICWILNPTRDYTRLKRFVHSLQILLMALVLGLFLLIWKRNKVRKLEEEQRLFALQMLTHELRTPITAMSLSLEAQRGDFDLLPPDSQKAFLQMADEFQRFHHIVEASKNYLKSHENQKPELETLPSVNEFVAHALESYQDQISFQLLKRDQVFNLNRYWIETCLKNLIENALQHGKMPVKVAVRYEKNDLRISVEDAGEFVANNKQSKGMGLGLVIVRKVIKDMGGDLLFETNPTRFTIQLRKYS